MTIGLALLVHRSVRQKLNRVSVQFSSVQLYPVYTMKLALVSWTSQLDVCSMFA